MTERKSPTAVLHEGPRALSDEQVREIEESDLRQVLDVDIDDVIEYVHKDLKSLPDFTTLYRKYLKQRWDVYDLDFTQDKIDWNEKMTEDERQSFMAIASGFHHGERQVEIELPVFMIGASEEEKLHIAAQIEDEARHTVFFDRFYREVVGLQGDDIMDILDASFPWVSETFVGPFGLLAYQADEVRQQPVRRAGAGALRHELLPVDRGRARAVGHEGDAVLRPVARIPARVLHRLHRDLPRRVAARAGRHAVPAGRGAQGPDDDQGDPRHAADDPVRCPGWPAARSTTSRWAGPRTRSGCCSSSSCGRKLNDVGIDLAPDLEDLLAAGAAGAGGRVSRWPSRGSSAREWAAAVRDALTAGPSEQARAGKLQEYWDFFELIKGMLPGVVGARLPRPARGARRRPGVPVRPVGRRHGHRLPRSSGRTTRSRPRTCSAWTTRTGRRCTTATTRSARSCTARSCSRTATCSSSSRRSTSSSSAWPSSARCPPTTPRSPPEPELVTELPRHRPSQWVAAGPRSPARTCPGKRTRQSLILIRPGDAASAIVASGQDSPGCDGS